jgi:hypothetical protein
MWKKFLVYLEGTCIYIYDLNILFRKEDGFDTHSLKEKAYQGREILSARDIMLTY